MYIWSCVVALLWKKQHLEGDGLFHTTEPWIIKEFFLWIILCSGLWGEAEVCECQGSVPFTLSCGIIWLTSAFRLYWMAGCNLLWLNLHVISFILSTPAFYSKGHTDDEWLWRCPMADCSRSRKLKLWIMCNVTLTCTVRNIFLLKHEAET